MKQGVLWFKDPLELVNLETIIEIVPVDKMPLNNKLNAIMRLSIIIAILLFVYRRSFIILLLPIFIGGISLYFNKYVEIINSKQINEQNKDGIDSTTVKFDKFIGRDAKCEMPTIDNPTMNFLMSDYYDNLERPEACDTIDDPDVRELMDKYINHGNYRDSDDVYNNQRRQDRFYTAPVTSLDGSKYEQFINWVYNNKTPTCKEDSSHCNVYEDIRTKRKPIFVKSK